MELLPSLSHYFWITLAFSILSDNVLCAEQKGKNLSKRGLTAKEMEYMNGFISVRMEPTELNLILGQRVEVKVNVSLSATYIQEAKESLKGSDTLSGIPPKKAAKKEKESKKKGSKVSSSNSIDKTGADTPLYIVTPGNSTQISYSSPGTNTKQIDTDKKFITEIISLGADGNIDYSQIMRSLDITTCCEDVDIARISDLNGEVNIRNTSKSYSFLAEGLSIGRTSIKFKVEKMSPFLPSLKNEPGHPQNSSNLDRTWWLPDEYKILVINKESSLSFYLNSVLFGKMLL